MKIIDVAFNGRKAVISLIPSNWFEALFFKPKTKTLYYHGETYSIGGERAWCNEEGEVVGRKPKLDAFIRKQRQQS